MGKVVTVDKEGRIIYDGLLTSKEKADIDEIIAALKEEIPQIEGDLKEEYGDSAMYKYYLGKFLGELLDRYEIPNYERVAFWKEIKSLATQETRIRNEGKNATRNFYEQCYVLSRFGTDTVEKLSWRQWQDILDRVGNREDERIFEWIRTRQEKIKEADWREFEKGLHAYLKGKDTSVFDEDELFAIYDSLLSMGQYWLAAFKAFEKENPKSAKIKTKPKRSKKYIATCLQLKKEQRKPLSEEIFAQAFEAAMK